MFLGAKRFGNKEQKLKRVLIFDIEQYRYQTFVSDLAGMDIHGHDNSPMQAVHETRDWLANVSRRQLPSGDQVTGIYQQFLDNLPTLTEELEFDSDNIPYVDFERIVVSWLTTEPAP